MIGIINFDPLIELLVKHHELLVKLHELGHLVGKHLLVLSQACHMILMISLDII